MDENLQKILIEMIGNSPLNILLLVLWYRCAQERRQLQADFIEHLKEEAAHAEHDNPQ